MADSKIKYEKRIVVFIDILGFKEIIKQSENNLSKIELIYSVLVYLKNWEAPEKWDLRLVEIEEDVQKKGTIHFDIRERINITAFSDSIVISVKVDDNINEIISTLIINLAYVGAILLEKGILFRGGITVGNLVHLENGTIFGQGVIDAYKLESTTARFPRIILSNKLLKELIYPINTKQERFPYHQYIKRFEDGCVGFHQMIYYQVIQSWAEMTKVKIFESLNKVRKVIIEGLDTNFETHDVFEKYKWLKEQYNKLVILEDFDFETKTFENIKLKIRELNEGNTGNNIHYSYTDKFYESKWEAKNKFLNNEQL